MRSSYLPTDRADRSRLAGNRPRVPRYTFWAVLAIAAVYVPLAFTYMWFVFDPTAPRLQEALNTALNGREYATGPATLAAVRDADYHQHRYVMTAHTVAGSVALVLALMQFTSSIRTRYPALHRWTGRVYLPLMTLSMFAAMIFLVLTSSIPYRAGAAFRLQLWMLAVGTLVSAWVAFAAIRRRDAFQHQAYMSLNLSLMLATPLLRVILIGLAPVLPRADELTNLGVASVVLGVVAPAAAAVTFMVTQTHPKPDDGSSPSSGGALGFIWPLAVAAAGAVLLGWRVQPLLASGVPASYLAFHLVPVVGYLGICLAGVARARGAGDTSREERWRTLLWGATTSSISAFATGLIVAVVYGPLEGFIAGLMVGSAVPVVATSILVVVRSSHARERLIPSAGDSPLAGPVAR